MDLELAKQFYSNGFKPVESGHPAVIAYLKESSARYIPLENLDRKRGTCKWCWKGKCETYRHKYCSNECRLSAEIFCYPQREYSKAYHLHIQKDKCLSCERTFGETYDGVELKEELDHIVPIFKGGQSLGYQNHQLLCVACHKWKSIEERKGWFK